MEPFDRLRSLGVDFHEDWHVALHRWDIYARVSASVPLKLGARVAVHARKSSLANRSNCNPSANLPSRKRPLRPAGRVFERYNLAVRSALDWTP
jgi:hypothetical protein